MKIPLVYPKIPDTTNCPLKKCWAFEKYDGTNMHFEFEKGNFISFGTRRDSFLFNEDGFSDFLKVHPELHKSIEVFDKYIAEYLFLYNSNMSGILFTEYLGPNSFAGQHAYNDTMRHVIIDLMIFNKLVAPSKFIEIFKPSPFEYAKLIYSGKYSGQFAEDVRNGKYPVNEGVIIKGINNKQVYMAKIKTNRYMERLKSEFKDNWQDYWE